MTPDPTKGWMTWQPIGEKKRPVFWSFAVQRPPMTAGNLVHYLNVAGNLTSLVLRGRRLLRGRITREEAVLSDADARRILLLMSFLRRPCGGRLSHSDLKMVNAWLEHIACHPQIQPDSKRGVKSRWIPDGDGYGEVVASILSFYSQNELSRFRVCASSKCELWFYAKNAKRKTHSTACRHALSYGNLTAAEKKARARYARDKMRGRRAALRAQKEAEIRRARRGDR